MDTTLVIPRRFRGPETSANGGWISGRLAGFLGARAEVTLRQPPPLETPLQVVEDGERVLLRHEDELVAEASPTTDEVTVPPFVPVDQATAAEARYEGHRHHEFPSCFTCGTGRAQGDGLRIFAGPVDGRPGVVASRWIPDESLPTEDGLLADPVVWAALDCPTVWPHLRPGVRALLGRMTAVVHRRPSPGEELVVVGQDLGEDGRKLHGGAAIFTTSGELLAASRALWVTVPPEV